MNDNDFLDWLGRISRRRVDEDIPELMLYIDRLPPSLEKRRAVGQVHDLLNGHVAILNQIPLQRETAPTTPDPRAFLADLQAVCDKHGLQLGHQDHHGAFTVERPKDDDEYRDLKSWLAAADIDIDA